MLPSCYWLGVGDWNLLLTLEAHHLAGRTPRSAVMVMVVLKLGSNRGQITHIVLGTQRSNSHEFRA
jgi:hypothetical protein